MTTHRLSAAALAVTLLCAAPATAGGLSLGGPSSFGGFSGGSAFDSISQPDRDRRRGGNSGAACLFTFNWHSWERGPGGDWRHKDPRCREGEGEDEDDTPITAPLDPEPEAPTTPVVTPQEPDPVAPSPVPLPAAGWLLLAALGGVAAVRRAR